jgi:DNA-binding MarR family transcriptional regulator
VGRVPTTDPARTADELATLVARLTRRLRAATPAAELTPSQQSVLARLGTGPATTAALARGELVRPQSMRATLAALEERELVVRSPHPTDGRQVVFSLTPRGTDLLGSGRRARRGWLTEAIETRLSTAEHRALADVLPLLHRLVDPGTEPGAGTPGSSDRQNHPVSEGSPPAP